MVGFSGKNSNINILKSKIRSGLAILMHRYFNELSQKVLQLTIKRKVFNLKKKYQNSTEHIFQHWSPSYKLLAESFLKWQLSPVLFLSSSRVFSLPLLTAAIEQVSLSKTKQKQLIGCAVRWCEWTIYVCVRICVKFVFWAGNPSNSINNVQLNSV